jgi:hypothetical protein
MERDPYCSIDNLYGECESQFLEMISAELSKEWRTRNNYIKLAKEKEKHDFSFGEWDKLSSNSIC